MSMITASTWVPRGAPAAFPVKYQVDEAELARISKLAKLQLEDAQSDLDKAKNGNAELTSADASSEEGESRKLAQSQGDVDDDLREYDLEHYDDEIVDQNGDGQTMFGNVQSLAYHGSNDDDPYITIKDDGDEIDEKDELQILSTDNMLVAAKVEDEVAHLEIYVYEDEADNLYVHHDIMLPAIPLCVEWLDLPVANGKADPDARGNYVAVGTFDPDIELWDLDTIDCMYPNAILGQGGETAKGITNDDTTGKKKTKRKKSKKANDSYHVDAILSLAANRQHRNLIASSSADKTVKLWDLNTTQCAKSYSYHTDKVCSIAWHPKEATVLLSGSYDRTAVAADMRAPEAKKARWGVESDVESVVWDPHNPNFFYVTTENGLIHFHDFRLVPTSPQGSKPIWKLQAHDQSVSSFNVNPVIPGFLATGSTDKEVKLWNIQASGPSLVVSRNLGVGKVFSTNFAPDPEVAFRLAVAGSKGSMQIWDTSTNAAVRRIFADKIAAVDGEVQADEKIIGVEEDSSDSEDEGVAEADGENQGKDHNDGESMVED